LIIWSLMPYLLQSIFLSSSKIRKRSSTNKSWQVLHKLLDEHIFRYMSERLFCLRLWPVIIRFNLNLKKKKIKANFTNKIFPLRGRRWTIQCTENDFRVFEGEVDEINSNIFLSRSLKKNFLLFIWGLPFAHYTSHHLLIILLITISRLMMEKNGN